MRVRVLGSVELDGSGRPRPKERSLLTLLALHGGRTVSTESLVGALWGEEPPKSATGSLQAHISRLRARLGEEAISFQGDGYRLELPDAEVDVLVFERLAQEGTAALAAEDPTRAAKVSAEALNLWGGSPGTDIHENSSAGGAVVQLVERHRIVEEDWASAQLALGRHREVLGDLDRHVREEPLREIRWEHLMVALYRSSQQGEALRAFARARQHLIEELGIEPGESLRRLEIEILQHAPDIDSRFPVQGPDESLRMEGLPLPATLETFAGTLLAGRSEERERLQELWVAARVGRRQLVVIEGGPGIGKTRLAAAIAQDVRADGAAVLLGRCEQGMGVPYQPFLEALRTFVRATRSADRERLLGESAVELTRLDPGLRTLVPELAQAEPGVSPETDRLLMYDAVAAWLAALSREAPVLLVIDDLQWAGSATLQLLRHVATHPEPAAMAILCSYRTTELVSQDPTRQEIMRLQQLGLASTVHLDGLDDREVMAWLETESGSALSEDGRHFAHVLGEQSDGNPLFVAELLRDAVESGEVSHDSGTWTYQPRDTGSRPLPPALGQAIRERANRLDDPTPRLLDVAAVAGPDIETAVLQLATGLDELAVAQCIDRAQTADLVVTGDRAGTFRFRHDVIREALRDEIGGAERGLIHRRLGEAIEQVHAAHADEFAASLATHYAAAAGDLTAQAIDWARRAADLAMDRLAWTDAAEWYSQALTLVGDQDERARASLLTRMAQAQRMARIDGAFDLADEALAMALRVGDREIAALAFVVRGLARTRERTFDPGLKADFDRVVAMWGQDESPMLAYLMAYYAVFVDPENPVASPDLGRAAFEMSERVGEPPEKPRILCGYLWSLHSHPERFGERLEVIDKVREAGIVDAYPTAICGLLQVRQLGKADQMLREMRARGRELGPPSDEWAAAIESVRASLAGNLTEAEQLADTFLEMSPDSMMTKYLHTRAIRRNRWWQGRHREILTIPTEPGQFAPGEEHLWRSEAHAALGESDLAAEHLEAAIDLGVVTNLTDRVAYYPALLPQVLVWSDKREEAAYLHRRYEAGGFGDVLFVSACDVAGIGAYLKGLLSVAAGERERAEADFARAHELYEELGARCGIVKLASARAHNLLALDRPGDGAAATVMLEQASTQAPRLGMVMDELWAHDLLRRC